MLDELPPPIDDHVFTVCHSWWRLSTRGAALTELGELEEAARVLHLARGAVDPGTAAWVTLLVRQARCAALRGDDELLASNAHETLAP